ncbi:hypothetical protein B0J11DRAFT_591861 [Dendryphion nanum]|uniref:Uncharacterized protein n=1 Tax=Dendryphion nanum TaxID=256645 RepID=A0A9P9DEL1_9PLEO|nr:hypothetical protein B0J11DRAFT_591861 [Dendryphion nanum]
MIIIGRLASWLCAVAVFNILVHASPLRLWPGKSDGLGNKGPYRHINSHHGVPVISHLDATANSNLAYTGSLGSLLAHGAAVVDTRTAGSITKRTHHDPMSDENWDKAVNYGCNLVGAMSVKDEQAAGFFGNTAGTCQSAFVTQEIYREWGYTRDLSPTMDFRAGLGPDLGTELKRLKINRRPDDQGGPMVATGWSHSRETIHDGITYPASTLQQDKTRAYYSTIYNVDDGLLVGWKKYGPDYMGQKQDPPVTILPKLKRWSDVVFADWMRLAKVRSKDPANLKYIMSAGIVNGETIAMLQRIYNVHDFDKRCQDFQHSRPMAMGMPEAKALLSSPNGRGAALLLIQHKAVFGDYTGIKTVWFWCSGYPGYWDLNLMFEVDKRTEPPK